MRFSDFKKDSIININNNNISPVIYAGDFEIGLLFRIVLSC